MRFECVPGSCPSGERCSNRQLQLGSTLSTAVIDCGRKGVGVITLEDAEAGRFVGEYVGEVLSAREANLRGQVWICVAH
jgi:SET domain-containing protein